MRKIDSLVNRIGEYFFEFQSKLQFFEREYLRKHGIEDVTPTEVKVLYIIGLSNTKSMSEIADELKVTRGTLSITIDSLVKKGYVIRTRHKQDRRVIIVYLTNKSIDVVRIYGRFYFELLKSLIKEFEREKIVVVEEILSKLNHIIETSFYEEVSGDPLNQDEGNREYEE
ncbi:MAG: MarR family transcriptional regulator [Bacilli bacterium]|nr:MarR family transcriptional regulator [Bacilli bacterium]